PRGSGGGDLDQPAPRAPLRAAGLHEPHGEPGDRQGVRRRAGAGALGRLPEADARGSTAVVVRDYGEVCRRLAGGADTSEVAALAGVTDIPSIRCAWR